MSGEGVGVGGGAAMNDVGAGGVRGIRPVVFGFGVVVVRRPGTTGAGKSGERGWGLSQIARCGLEDSVVVDGSDIGAGRGFGLGQEKARSQ